MTHRNTAPFQETKMLRQTDQAAGKRLILTSTRMTVHNGPGIRTLILLKGCPLHCLWCSTPESQEAGPEIGLYPAKCTRCGLCVPVCPLNAITLRGDDIGLDRTLCDACGRCTEVCRPEAVTLLGRAMTVGALVDLARKDRVFYKHSGGGVTISGGEPLLSPAFTAELARALKEEGIGVGIDTCGHAPWTNVEAVLPYIDFFLWDIKHMDPERHRKLTGVSNDLILRNARAVSERNIPIYIRVPVIPGYNDSEENIRAICEMARGLSSVVEVDLLPLHHLGKARYDSLNRDYPTAHLSLIPDRIMEEMKRLVESYGLKCVIGG